MENLGNPHSPRSAGKRFYNTTAIKFTVLPRKLVYRSLAVGGMTSEVSYRNRKVLHCGIRI